MDLHSIFISVSLNLLLQIERKPWIVVHRLKEAHNFISILAPKGNNPALNVLVSITRVTRSFSLHLSLFTDPYVTLSVGCTW